MVQICADALGVPIERVSYAPQDSDVSPYNWKTAGSRSTYMTGRAVVGGDDRDAATDDRSCGRDDGMRGADLELRPGGAVGAQGRADERVSFKEVALHSLFRSGGPIAATHGFVFDGPGFDPKRASIHRLAFANLGVYTFGAHCVEVEVDEATGAVDVRARVVRARRRPRHQSGELRRADPGRLRAGHGLRAHRGDALERRRLADDRPRSPITRSRARLTCRPRSTRSSSRIPSRRIRSAPKASASLRWWRGARHRQRHPRRGRSAAATPADDARARARRARRRRRR